MATISTVDNALDSLKRIPGELAAAEGTLAVKSPLIWGWHAAALLAHHRLRPARDVFDQWFWVYLEGGESALEVDRDSRWEERQRLSLFELIDVLSDVELPILKPEFYHGWQDRTTRCQTLRRRVADVIGTSLGEEQRNDLLILLAGYHRLLRLPAPVDLDESVLWGAMPVLFDLIEMLINPEHDHSAALLEAVGAARRALPSG